MNSIMKKMKPFSLSFIAALCCVVFQSSAQIDTPAPSPDGSVTATVGLTEVEINYSRPQTKGRKIFGEGDDFLVPFGKMWRAGANAGTKVKFSDNVKVAGQDLEAGEYLLLTIPAKDEWVISFYGDLALGGNVAGFDEEKEVLRVTVKSSKLTESVGTLTFNISEISENSTTANLELAWENTSVKVPFEVSFDEAVMKAITENTKVNPRSYVAAANYYFNNDKDIDQALTWMNLYLAEGENSKQFWHLHTKAKMLAKKGNKKAAKKVAEESLELATNFERGDFGYIKRNEELIASLK